MATTPQKNSEILASAPTDKSPPLSKQLGEAKTSEEAFRVQTAAQEAVGKTEREISEKEIPFLTEARGAYRARLRDTEAFAPTQESAGDLTGLFAILATTAFMSGGSGKYSGMQSLNSLAGAMEGYQKGRKDLFNQEMKNWEKNFQLNKDWNDKQLTDYKMAFDTYTKNPQLGIALFKEIGAKEPDGLVNAYINRGELEKVVKTAEQRVKQLEKAEEKVRDLNNKYEFERFKAEMKAPQGLLKATGEVSKGYIAQNILSADLQGLLEDLKDKNLTDQMRKYRWESFFQEEGGKFINQLLSETIPSELRAFLTKVRDIRNNYYLDISGKAVTGAEAMRNYSAVPQPGDTPESMLDKIGGMKGRIDKKIRQYQYFYGFPSPPPDLIVAGTKTDLQPGLNYEQGEKALPVVSTKEQYDALPSNTEYYEIDQTGRRTLFRKP